MKTAKEILNNTINSYKTKVRDFSKFAFDEEEFNLFASAMEEYKNQFTSAIKEEEAINYLEFGCYVEIEQYRFHASNEFYQYKVIGRGQSNTYVDVPCKSNTGEVIHNEVVDVVSCICMGVCETEVLKFRVSDVKQVLTNNHLSQLKPSDEEIEQAVNSVCDKIPMTQGNAVHEYLICRRAAITIATQMRDNPESFLTK